MSKHDVHTPTYLSSPSFDSSVRSKAKQLEKKLIHQTLDDINSYNKACEVEHDKYTDQYVASHHGHPPPAVTPPEVVKEWRNTIQNGYYDWVVPAFERYLSPDPDALNPMINALDSVVGSFNGGQSGESVHFASNELTRINDIRSDMGQWQGGLKENFIDNFLTPLQTASLNVGKVVKCADDQLKLVKIVYVRQRKELLTLLDKSLDAVEHLKHACSGHDAVMWATLLGCSVATAALAVPSAGTSVVIAASVLSIASTMGQGLIPDEEKDKNNLAASTAQEVASNIADALTRLDHKTSAEEEKLRKSLMDLYKGISKARSAKSGPISVPEPNVDNASATDVSKGLHPTD